MVCNGAVDEIKCQAFPVTLTRLASQWFTSLSASSISIFFEVKELFLNEFTTSIDNTKHPINPVAVIQKPNETTRKFIKRFNAECKTIDGLVDAAASLCLTNGFATDDFRKQWTTKLVWSQKEMQVIDKEFIHHEKVNRVVAATKNLQAHMAPRGSGQTHNPRDKQ
ncbi:hypothetical protein PIB30_049934 [Stylosanthes scabra]|uniref:Retrotransposon gag domain-containing protein n=1 Tax=Stylosanthes scabra TaxID=79078 RepID=A0ABU6RHT7_9FABA|nr:hypothetical protein [Stylosanthes scabra]